MDIDAGQEDAGDEEQEQQQQLEEEDEEAANDENGYDPNIVATEEQLLQPAPRKRPPARSARPRATHLRLCLPGAPAVATQNFVCKACMRGSSCTASALCACAVVPAECWP